MACRNGHHGMPRGHVLAPFRRHTAARRPESGRRAEVCRRVPQFWASAATGFGIRKDVAMAAVRMTTPAIMPAV